MNARTLARDKKYMPRRPWPKKAQLRKVVKVIHYAGGYEIRTELVDNLEYLGLPNKWWDRPGRFMTMRSAYTTNGDYIGNPRTARRLVVKRGLSMLQKTDPKHCVCTIGFNAKEGKWYGWSHRAICGFGLGDRIFNERWKKQRADGKTPYKQHGDRVITQYAHAKLAAKRFASSVS